MGRIQEFQCPSCHETWKLFVGHGRNHGTMSRVLPVFPLEIQKEIWAEAKGDPEPLFRFNYQRAVCRNCKNLVAVPVFHFIESGKSFVSKCPDCGSVTELLEDTSDIVCPHCGKGNLTGEEVGNWD